MRRVIILAIIFLISSSSCGGGAVINLSGGGESGNGFDGTGGSLEEILANNLPGTQQTELQSQNYDAVIESGSGASIIDSYTQSGKYQLKNSLVFGN